MICFRARLALFDCVLKFFVRKMAVKSLKQRISRSLKEAQFPFVGSMAMRNIMTRFVYIGRIMVPRWLTSLSL